MFLGLQFERYLCYTTEQTIQNKRSKIGKYHRGGISSYTHTHTHMTGGSKNEKKHDDYIAVNASGNVEYF